MGQLQKPKNDWAKAIWILNDCFMCGVSMAKVLRDYEPFFYKFQTRLLEVEKAHPKLRMSRVTLTHESKITGKVKSYTHYTPLCPKPYIINLYNLINENGFKGKHNKPDEIIS